ncbi:chitobiase/beta-hexosaminidase C-terminal domain-containing protein [Streptomyces johnsoniae]|uniref:Chitobiase/beta-hexosaminidase C-terminal domain-containing protein n=1 Tax=Streptomyces johnsoniae TaxID=3075532 RepID=A0ABU2SG08_9ACTN|nr:chitobiase/beta-hexosaminidase C-terminal domain-containing protein [Streptomyces sp. DSM 41886]MDT0446700.1 chitobiase/beta-hexosaminidase C-terminal domain-containing protein [Streptomyces sp. DSM 41886]
MRHRRWRASRAGALTLAATLTLGLLPATALITAGTATAASTEASTEASAYDAIPNGQTWLDTDGNAIQAHGGGFLKVGDTYYWVGENKAHGSAAFGGVNLYKSTDLENWENAGAILSVDSADVNGNRILAHSKVERPKLLYNEETGKYVLWGHYEMPGNYAASEVIVATADDIEGPYTITEKGHFRPGAGNEGAEAMGDRAGALIEDWDTAARDETNTEHAYRPAQADYPPRVHQYQAPDADSPEDLQYVSDEDYGTSQAGNGWSYHLNDIAHDMTLKAQTYRMEEFDRSAYDTYSADYNTSTGSYIVRYPTEESSAVATADYVIGDPGGERAELAAPGLHPTLEESSSEEVVFVNGQDSAFVTTNTDGAQLYFTTDGSDPADGSNEARQRYWDGMRLSLAGEAGQRTTVRAVAVLDGETSEETQVTYEVAEDPADVPLFRPVLNRPSGTYDGFGYKELRVYSPSYGAEVYYTMDGQDPDPAQRGENIGFGSRDLTVYQDEKTGDAYLITAQDHIYMRVWKLNDEFTDVVPELEYDMYVGDHREAPALVRHGGTAGQYVYLLTSSQSGWYPNQTQYGRTEDLDAGFDQPRDEHGYRNGQSIWSALQPVGDNTAYHSQPTRILNIGTEAEPEYVYMGDRWRPDLLSRSTYVWMPLTIDDAGNDGNGLVDFSFTPELDVDVAGGRINEPDWELVSLNQPVEASPQVDVPVGAPAEEGGDWETTPEQEEQEGIYRHYNAEQANDGIDHDLDIHDDTEQFFKSEGMPFHWQVDLGEPTELSWIGLSFKTVSGSDNVHRYAVSASNDGERWTELADNTSNLRIGYQNHALEGQYRYVRVDVYSSFDLAHGRDAAWARGLYEVSVYGSGQDTAPEGPQLAAPEDGTTVRHDDVGFAWEPVENARRYEFQSFRNEELTEGKWQRSTREPAVTARNVRHGDYWWRVRAVLDDGTKTPWSDAWQVTVRDR